MDFTWAIVVIAVLLAAGAVMINIKKQGEPGDQGDIGPAGKDGEAMQEDLTREADNWKKGIKPGMIVAFYGDTIPDTWKLCDGNFGTPNLMNRFIYGANTIDE